MDDNTPALETTPTTPEDQLAHLTHETEALHAQLAEVEQSHATEREAERALTAAGAIDLDISTPLIVAAIAAAKIDENTDRAKAATKAVAELKARKPFLFAASASPRIAGAMAPTPRASASTQPTREQLAEQARTTGDRGALLRYLKSRRAA